MYTPTECTPAKCQLWVFEMSSAGKNPRQIGILLRIAILQMETPDNSIYFLSFGLFRN